jgi:hypothetical protein
MHRWQAGSRDSQLLTPSAAAAVSLPHCCQVLPLRVMALFLSGVVNASASTTSSHRCAWVFTMECEFTNGLCVFRAP